MGKSHFLAMFQGVGDALQQGKPLALGQNFLAVCFDIITDTPDLTLAIGSIGIKYRIGSSPIAIERIANRTGIDNMLAADQKILWTMGMAAE